MKRILLISALVILVVIPTMAQKPSNNGQKEPVKIVELKRDFFKDSLNLTVDVSSLFWTKFDVIEQSEHKIYEDFRKDLEEHGIVLKPGQKNKLTKAQQIYVIEKRIEMKEKLMGLEKERFNEYKDVLPDEQLIKYYDLDKQFKEEMTKKWKGR